MFDDAGKAGEAWTEPERSNRVRGGTLGKETRGGAVLQRRAEPSQERCGKQGSLREAMGLRKSVECLHTEVSCGLAMQGEPLTVREGRMETGRPRW